MDGWIKLTSLELGDDLYIPKNKICLITLQKNSFHAGGKEAIVISVQGCGDVAVKESISQVLKGLK